MKYQIIEDAYEALFTETMTHIDENMLADAKDKYIQAEDESDIEGFNEWLIFDYLINNGGVTHASTYAKKNPTEIHKAFENSYRSIFEVKPLENALELHDLLTKETFVIKAFPLAINGLASLRIIKLDEAYSYIGEIVQYEMAYKDIMLKHILDQYNQVVIVEGPMSMADFLKGNGHLFYKISGAIHELHENYLEEDDYVLHEAVYVFKLPQKEIVALISSIADFKLEKEDPSDEIYHIIYEDRIAAELEFENVKLNILCNQAADLEMIINAIKPLLNESFVFMKQEVKTIDDLL